MNVDVMKMICELYAADNGVTQQYERAFEACSAHLLIENVLYQKKMWKGGRETNNTGFARGREQLLEFWCVR